MPGKAEGQPAHGISATKDTTTSGGRVDAVYSKGYRQTSVRYPNARLVHYDYGSGGGTNDRLSRVEAIRDDSTGSPGTPRADWADAKYSYNGAGRIVVEDYEQPDVRLDYYRSADDTPTAGTYAGLDRFGRVKMQRWRFYGASAANLDLFNYGYDTSSNRTWREVAPTDTATGKDEFYTYDKLGRLKTFARGDLNGSYTGLDGTAAREEGFVLDQQGNWSNYNVSVNGSATLNQTRTHDAANQITDISKTLGDNWIDPVYDARGNMTNGPKAVLGSETTELRFAYDAWNRLVQVRDSSETEIARYYHDGLNRRIHKALPAGGGDWYTGDWYYNLSWQLLEDRHKDEPVNDPKYVGTTVRYQAVWSLRYIDAPVLFDAVAEPSRTYLLNDANMNVTAALSASGVIQERTVYDPYGRPTFYSASWTCYGPTTRHTPNPFLFCGYYYDAETGLYQVRNRMYHPGLGRWMQRDLIVRSLANNDYQYGDDKPLSTIDPSGAAPIIWGEDKWTPIKDFHPERIKWGDWSVWVLLDKEKAMTRTGAIMLWQTSWRTSESCSPCLGSVPLAKTYVDYYPHTIDLGVMGSSESRIRPEESSGYRESLPLGGGINLSVFHEVQEGTRRIQLSRKELHIVIGVLVCQYGEPYQLSTITKTLSIVYTMREVLYSQLEVYSRHRSSQL